MKHIFIIVFCLTSLLLSSQSQSDGQSFDYDVKKIYPYLSITKDEVQAAKTIWDLNPRFKTEWISEYVKVEIKTTEAGQSKTSTNADQMLTDEQKTALLHNDPTQKVEVVLHYRPKNNLAHNPVRQEAFSLQYLPTKDAEYPGGKSALIAYLEKEVFQMIADSSYTGYELSTVKFVIGDDGSVSDVKISWQGKEKKVDRALYEAICNLQRWSPAVHSDGSRTSQQYALVVGNLESCAMNTEQFRRKGIWLEGGEEDQ